MSLDHPVALHAYRLGIFPSKDLDSPQLLEDLLGAKADTISHLVTNGASPLVAQFGMEHGIPVTIYPISGGRGLPASTKSVLAASDYALIIASEDSDSAAKIAAICEEWNARMNDQTRQEAEKDGKDVPEPVTHWRRVPFEPIAPWKNRVCKASEILACMNPEELKDSLWAKSVGDALAA